jgi:hypothetical protein
MTELLIRSLRATVPAVEDAPSLGGRVSSMLRRVAEHRLDDALAELELPAGEWCIRRLDVLMPLAIEDNDATIERQWAASLAAALRTALADGSNGVIRYPRPDDALDDLVGELAAGRTERAWAWHQLGLLADAGAACAPGEALVAALRRRPESATAALVRYLRGHGIAALHRMLGGRGWRELAAITASAAGAPALRLDADPTRAEPGRSARAHAIAERSELASAVPRSGLRPEAGTVRAWAVLAVAEVDPAQLRRADAADLVAEVAELLAPQQPQPGFAGWSARPAGGRDRQRDRGRPLPGTERQHGGRPDDADRPARIEPGDRSAAGLAPAATAGEDGRPGDSADGGRPADSADGGARPSSTATKPDEPAADAEDRRDTATTDWAGLLFLLAAAGEAGVPDALLDDDALAGRTLRWALHRIGLLLVPAAADDPAVLCFAGLTPFDPPPAGEPATPAELAALDRHARRWAAVTLARLASQPGQHELLRLARRRAVILADPGWIEVQLELAEVDIEVRCAGLDIDPGWLPWLGVVLRYRYG